MQIHATNINGLGASQVVKSFLEASNKTGFLNNATIFLPNVGFLSSLEFSNGVFKKFKRILPNSLSRLLECLFSRVFFADIPTIVLGDIPLRGINNQVVLVHQPNLIYPKVNPFSSKNLTFRISRFLFLINHKFAKKIIVQTAAMAEDLIKSYPNIKDKIIISLQPVPSWLNMGIKENLLHDDNVKDKTIFFFYPSAFYPHKKHDFLLRIENYLKLNSVSVDGIKIWLTLTEDEFKPYESFKWLINLGRLNPEEMNYYYQRADSLLFLSSMESYGLPIIEALSINLPIVSVDLPYARCLCDGAVYYFKPYEEKSFIEALFKQREDIFQKIKPNYLKVMEKFPSTWDDVVVVFKKALFDN